MSWFSGRASREEAAANTAALLRIIDGLQAEKQELVRLLVDMKREGFHPAPPVAQLAGTALDVPEEVELAIRDRATKGSDLESELRRWGAEMVRGGAAPAQVAQMVLRGGGDDGE